MSQTSRGMYFEDFAVGQTFRNSARTITSTDIVNFARKCVKHDGSVAQEMEATLMYRRRPGPSA